MSVAQRRACKTCPFRRDATSTWFPPAALEASIGENLRTGYAHTCHATNNATSPKVCAGFVRFVTDRQIPNRMLGMAEALGVFDPSCDVDRVSDIETSSWDAVLDMHRAREAADATDRSVLRGRRREPRG